MSTSDPEESGRVVRSGGPAGNAPRVVGRPMELMRVSRVAFGLSSFWYRGSIELRGRVRFLRTHYKASSTHSYHISFYGNLFMD